MKEFIYLLENGQPVKILAKKRITPNTNFSKIGTGELQIRIWEWHIADKKMDWCMPGFPEVSPADIFKMKYVGEIKSQYFLKVRFREQTEVCCFKVFKNMPTRWEIEKACFPKVRFTEEQYDSLIKGFSQSVCIGNTEYWIDTDETNQQRKNDYNDVSKYYKDLEKK